VTICWPWAWRSQLLGELWPRKRTPAASTTQEITLRWLTQCGQSTGQLFRACRIGTRAMVPLCRRLGDPLSRRCDSGHTVSRASNPKSRLLPQPQLPGKSGITRLRQNTDLRRSMTPPLQNGARYVFGWRSCAGCVPHPNGLLRKFCRTMA
jgi:hypothetical protein